jgi:hypothetical protein
MKTPTNYNCPICKDGTKIEEKTLEWGTVIIDRKYSCPKCHVVFNRVPDKEPQKETPRTLKVGDWVECTGKEEKEMRNFGLWINGKWQVDRVYGDCGCQVFRLVNDPWTNLESRIFDNRYRIVDPPEEQSEALPKFESVEKLRANEEAVVFISSIVDADSSESKYHRDYVHALLAHDRQTEKRLRILAEHIRKIAKFDHKAQEVLKQAGLDPWPEEWK